MHSRIIVTAANDPYEQTALTLIASIHRLSFDLIDKIYIFDLGLSKSAKQNLKRKKVEIVELPDHIDPNPKQHVYKCYIMDWAKDYGKEILWLDAGVMLLKPIDEIFNVINNEGIFLVGDPNHKNKAWTHQKCIDIMGANKKELNALQLSSGILGYKSGGPYQKLINEAHEYSKINGCVQGDHSNHRHDQSVYSILASRYNCKLQDIEIYGYWTNHKKNIDTAKKHGAVIFVHRNGHWDLRGLK